MLPKLTRHLLLLTLAAPLFGGGFWLQLSPAVDNPEAAAKHAVLVVRPAGCHNPERAKLTATAEGFVDGQRRSLPVTLLPLSELGVYAIARTWPVRGSWVVSIAANADGRQTGALTIIQPDGHTQPNPQFMPHAPTRAEVENLVQSAAKAA